MDSTSVHVDGRYNSAEEPDTHVIHSMRGYGWDHRPDLNHVMLDLMMEQQAGIPLLMKPLSGTTSDASDFGPVVTTHIAQLHTTYGTMYLVAESALYSAENLQQLAHTGSRWITRVPATLSEGSRSQVLTSTDGGVAQRGVLIYSD
ncbi:MAG: hypothetical protein ACREOH_23860 [Candidatus Entotheonellia bacterium]